MKLQQWMIGAVALCVGSVVAVDVAKLTEEDMFPFVPSYEGVSAVVDMAHLLDAPAGKNGRVRVKDGHFVNDKGRVKLHATNLTGPANFPTHQEAERLAKRFAAFGINCVRLHYFDSAYGTFMLEHQQGIIAEDFRTRRRLDPTQRDRQDYLIAQFKKRGIYVDINLHVARHLDARDGFAPGTPWANKGVDQFDPRVIAAEKEYAKELLSHVNPYTGMNYLKDPVVAIVELNNEDALWCEYRNGAIDRLSEPYATIFKNLWNDWLVKKYGTGDKMREAWKLETVPLGAECVQEGAFNDPVVADGKKWVLDLSDAKLQMGTQAGALRLTITKEGSECYPKIYRRVQIQKDVPYTVAFKIRRVQGKAGDVGFAMASRIESWRSLGVLDRFQPGTAWEKHSYTFTPDITDKMAEIQFTRFDEGVYEIDDLSFRTGYSDEAYKALIASDPNKGEVPILKSRGAALQGIVRDFYQFLNDTESAYWMGMKRYLQDDLGLEAPVSATQLGYSPPHVQAELDFVDNHAYWYHPTIHKNWFIGNFAMVNNCGGCLAWMAAQRVAGKPYTISEYNHPYPNFYGAEAQPMLRAYGALQGWDGVFEYSYNNRKNAEPINNEYFFSLAARSDVLAHFPACAAMYLRGDVAESATKIVGNLPYEDYFKRLCATKEVAQGIASSDAHISGAVGLVHGIAVDLTGKSEPVKTPIKEPSAVAVSDTKELVWDRSQAGRGVWSVNTRNTKVVSGFAEGRTLDLDGVKVTLGKTKLGWGTISLVSHDATGFGSDGKPATILVTATGLSHNGGAKFTDRGKGMISCCGDDWGKGKTVCEGIRANIALPVKADRVQCWALDEAGKRHTSVAVSATPEGNAKFDLGPQYRTVWYEVQVK